MCAFEYRSKLKDRGINRMYIGVELLYKHARTPQGFITKRFPIPRAKRTKKRRVWKIR